MTPTIGKRLVTGLARFTSAVLCAAVVAVGAAAAEESFTPEKARAIEKIVREYILKNPEIIIEAARILRAREETAARNQMRRTIFERRDELFNDPASPVGGNPKGDVTVVEFFDYQCPYCKRVFPSIQALLAEDRNLRYVFKEFPILGKASVFAARAALAAQRQGKYLEFHMAVMAARGKWTEARVMRLAKTAGLDVDRLRRDMADGTIDDSIRRNLELASALNVNGTPAFVVGDTVVPGAVDIDTLRSLIARARQTGKIGKTP
ncbi:MAG: DsbA family protein [Alphaproteobacteria bacterium]|nr:DsbA family protein [Alphaproteobacteria bacterium]